MELTGKRILVVEDDFYLADEICRDLRLQGAVVVGPAPTPFYALQLLGRRGVDSAVLDVQLHGTTVFGLADELTQRGTPIIFATAHGEEAMPERYKSMPRVAKPYERSRLIEALIEIDRVDPLPVQIDLARRDMPVARTMDARTRMMSAICANMRRTRISRATAKR